MQRTWKRGYVELVRERTIEDSLKELEGFITSIHSGNAVQVDDLHGPGEFFPGQESNYTTRRAVPVRDRLVDEIPEYQPLVAVPQMRYHMNRVSMAVRQREGENGRKMCGTKSSAIIPPWIDVPECSRFFVIKSSCLEHVKKSFYNGIWSSTHFGNKRLSEAYANLAAGAKIFLFFSVNASGRFCGVAEMTSDLESGLDTSIWGDTKRYETAFKVRWIIVRDVPNRLLKRFLIPANEMKPVTNSRDTQEIPATICKSILKLFKYDQSSVQSFLDHDYS